MTYIQQNGSVGRNTPYPNKSNPRATIATSGCGVCSSLMVLLNSTKYKVDLKTWTKKVIACGGRVSSGSDMGAITSMMKIKYGFKVTPTTDINKLKAHLKKGYKAVLHVGQHGYFSSGGHYVCAAGITSSGKAIILDPYQYSGKWTSTVKGVNRSKYFKYDSKTHEVYCSFQTITADRRGYYWLLTPTKKASLQFSKKDVKYAKPKTTSSTSKKKTDLEIAKEVIDGKWGDGETRKKKLKAAGYNYKTIQALVNKLLK